MNAGKVILLLIASLVLCGCAGTVVVADKYPVPVVEPLPYRVGYLLDYEFRSYTYADENDNVSFDLGPQQSALFSNVFSAVFAAATAVEQLPGAATEQASEPIAQPGAPGSLDLILQPKLIEYAYLSPEDTASKFYSASMKYQVRIYTGQGKLLGYWPLVAYGKSRTKLMNRHESLGEATSLALRDAAAALATKFRTAVETEQWRTEEDSRAAN